MLTMSFEQPAYSLVAPEFLSDPAAAAARSIAVGDVSGDGRDDLVFLSVRTAPNPNDSRMQVYVAHQRVDGRLDTAIKIAEWGNEFDYQLLIADLDRNGVGDIITTARDDVMVLRSNVDGTFTSSAAAAGDPHELRVTDVDRDGYLDVLVDSGDTWATVVHGGPGGIEGTSTLTLPSSGVRTTGDVTGDGMDDLILAAVFNRPLEEFHIYPALASGGYATPVVLSLPLGSNPAGSLAVGDFNADGRGDLALDEAKDYANLRLYFQDSQGNLSPSLEVARQRGSGSLIASDLDRDGRTDLAIAHSGWSYVGYFLQTSTGFTPETVVNAYQSMGRANYFTAGDLNHDGCGDLVVSRWSQSPVVLYGQGCVTRPPMADCRLPALEARDSGVGGAGLAVPMPHQRNGDAVSYVSAERTRGTGLHFERSRRDARGVSLPKSARSN
ncbi:FG-GAP repeat domain-containing protein [Lysobacter silvisoli]|nr:VCBS repeat-containing protein [Lysobacter silvisoli]